MQLARVIGTVVATIKNDSLQNRKLLVIQSLNKDLAPQGKPMGLRVAGEGGSEGRPVIGRIGVEPLGDIIPRESGQTSFRCRRT